MRGEPGRCALRLVFMVDGSSTQAGRRRLVRAGTEMRWQVQVFRGVSKERGLEILVVAATVSTVVVVEGEEAEALAAVGAMPVGLIASRAIRKEQQ